MNVHTSLTTFVADKQWLVPGVGMPHPHFSLSRAEIQVQTSLKTFLDKLIISWNKAETRVPKNKGTY